MVTIGEVLAAYYGGLPWDDVDMSGSDPRVAELKARIWRARAELVAALDEAHALDGSEPPDDL